jgi:galactitol-specific phosphotransferase system IIC component
MSILAGGKGPIRTWSALVLAGNQATPLADLIMWPADSHHSLVLELLNSLLDAIA